MRKIEEVFVNGICLKDILDKHKKWIKKEEGGERAELINADLSNTDLSFACLICANLRCVDLKKCLLI